ncbi:SDR family NAD(P)-dependent oxidoreductase [Nocardioides sp. SLBN-35]|uniref:SDR family NAD(P)-dependent oxidoreductase n=1 Tax=Nocardioides sp. SLBN-35 TaxID=2768445 RepID=UPI001153765F|nr:SDR family NAD(P)-dependent oxidoreductase [Nocardioides sp. SLBN-35]TQK68961.1 NADP-dependent 3-hydroxy acid dehydrogenase YdfG [Nocardioides sp. SLBN-35]
MTTAHDVFSGRTAVITGAGSGIGKGLAQHAASLGMKLVLADIDEDRLSAVASELPGEVLSVVTDVADAAAVDRLAEAAFERFGSVELVVNNAGVMRIGYSWAISAQDWDTAIDVNLRGVVNGVRAFVPRLVAQGTAAHVVNVASVGGFLPSPMMAPYTATKFAVLGLTESLAMELQMAQSPVKVSVVTPGPVRSEIFAQAPATEDPALLGFHQYLAQQNVEEGIPGDEYARIVLDAVAAGEYWVITHPEFTDAGLAARAEMITTRTAPSVSLG